MYRAMKAQADGFPAVGPSARTLGLRTDGPNREIPISPPGTVSPTTGGMSVALDVALNLPKNRLPKSLGGEGRDPVQYFIRCAPGQPFRSSGRISACDD